MDCYHWCVTGRHDWFHDAPNPTVAIDEFRIDCPEHRITATHITQRVVTKHEPQSEGPSWWPGHGSDAGPVEKKWQETPRLSEMDQELLESIRAVRALASQSQNCESEL